MVERQTLERAVSTALVPGYAALVMLILLTLFRTLVHPAWLIVPVGLYAGVYGWHAIYTAMTQPDTRTGLRVRLLLAGALNVALLWVLPLLWVLLG